LQIRRKSGAIKEAGTRRSRSRFNVLLVTVLQLSLSRGFVMNTNVLVTSELSEGSVVDAVTGSSPFAIALGTLSVIPAAFVNDEAVGDPWYFIPPATNFSTIGVGQSLVNSAGLIVP
jgi:hypothetical protein